MINPYVLQCNIFRALKGLFSLLSNSQWLFFGHTTTDEAFVVNLAVRTFFISFFAEQDNKI